MRLPVLLSIPLLFSGSLFSATIQVPADQPTIQAGINAALAGDTVLVAPGTYTGTGNRDIDFFGKAVHLKSQDGPYTTTIDGQASPTNPHRGFVFHSGEGPNTVVEGFTIINCVASRFSHGGGMWGWDLPPVAPTIKRNVITNCGAGRGGGALFQNGATPTIINNTIVNNFAYTTVNGGLQTDGGLILNNIIRNNIRAKNFSGGSVIKFNNIQNGPLGDGNIDVDPLFVDAANGDFHLALGSPSIDAGNPDPQYNDPDGSRNDMGAFPYSCTGSECIVCGDVNDDGLVTTEDLTFLINFYFLFGDPPVQFESSDVNGDGMTDISDIISLSNYLNGIGPAPCSVSNPPPHLFDPKEEPQGHQTGGY